MANVITPTTAIAYLLTDGTVRDKSGDSNFHPNSTENQIIVYVEDGDSNNVMTINYNPAIRKTWASHWFPLFYRGLVEHTLEGESEPRTFAQYQTYMPTIVSAMNINSSTTLGVNVTVRQQAGNNLIGAYDTVENLPTSYGDWLDLQDLEENNVVAYVYEAGVNGFYMVEYDTELETYSWVLQTSGITNYVDAKSYDVWACTILAGFSNPNEITELTDEQYRLIWQELSQLSSYYTSNYDLIQELIDGTTPAGKAVADQNGNVIDTTYQLLSNLVTAFQETPDDTHYASEKLIYDTIQDLISDIEDGTIIALKASQDDDGNDIVDTYTPMSRTIAGIDLQDNIDKAEMQEALDIDDIENNIDEIEGDVDDLENANMIKSIERTGTDLVTITYYDDTTDTVITLAQLKTFIGDAVSGTNGLFSVADKAKLDTLYALLNDTTDGTADDLVDNITEILAIFENYPEGADLLTALAAKVDKTRTIAGVDLVDDITVDELREALEIDNLDNTSDENKPVSTAQQAALDLKRNNNPSTLASTTPANDDILDIWDTSAGALKKIDISALLALIASGVTSFINSADYESYGLGAYETATVDIHNGVLNTGSQVYIAIKTAETNKLYYVQMPTISSSNNLELSVDNQTTYYDVLVSGHNIIGSIVSDKLLAIYFDGSNFNLLSTEDLTYTITHDETVESTYGVVAPLAGGTPEINSVKGLTLYQMLTDGDDFATSWNITAASGSVSGGVYSFTATASYGGIYQLRNFITGNKYYIAARVKASSNLVKLALFNTTSHPHSGSGNYEILSAVDTAGSSCTRIDIFDSNASGWAQVDVDWIIAIPLTNTPLSSYTASQVANLLTTYWEGYKDIENPSIKSVGKNLFDKSNITKGYFIVYNTGEPYADSTGTYSEYISVKPSTSYIISGKTVYYTGGLSGLAFYDKDQNYISGHNAATATTSPSNARYIRLTVAIADLDTFQLEEGTTATTYQEYRDETFTLYGTARSVGTVRDEWKKIDNVWSLESNVGYDDSALKAVTTWSIANVLTNTHQFYKDLDAVILFKVATADATAVNIYVKIGTTVFQVVSHNYLIANDVENLVSININGLLSFRVNKTTYPNTAALEAYLQANDVEFYYELATPTTAEAEFDGTTYQDSVTTIIQENNNATAVEITYALNESAQVPIILQRLATLFDKNDENEVDIAALQAITTPATDDLRFPVITLHQGAAYNPDFDTTNIGLLFPQNDTSEYVYVIAQMPHSRQADSDIWPHIHCRLSGAGQPVIKIDYKWYNPEGETIPGTFTTYTMNVNTATWSTGTISNMIFGSAAIDGTGKDSSSILIGKIYRDDNVYVGDLLVDEFDIHYTKDKFGDDSL